MDGSWVGLGHDFRGPGPKIWTRVQLCIIVHHSYVYVYTKMTTLPVPH